MMRYAMSTAPAEIKTSRLRMRRLRTVDISKFAAMNADPDVMEFFPRPWSLSESQTILQKINFGFDERGFGTYAVEFETDFAGVIGLSVPSFEAPFTPCVEILWRLRPHFWGKGIAAEGAAAILDLAFRTLLLREVVAFTAAIVMVYHAPGGWVRREDGKTLTAILSRGWSRIGLGVLEPP
jgi:RimJ/RimL family protein N-acetyltransferase